MDKQILARIFVLLSYMIGAYGVPLYLFFKYALWIFNTYNDRLIQLIATMPYGILMGFYFWICLGIFGYSIGEE